MLDSDDLKAWPAFAAIALWIVWRIYVHVSSSARMRKRRERIDHVASGLGLQLDPDPKSPAIEELHHAYNEAVTTSSNSDKVGFGISSLYRGSGLSIFEFGKFTRKGSREGIALGVDTPGLGVPPFRRRRLHSFEFGLDEARRRGNVLDLSDGSFVLVRDPQDKASISRVFSPAVMTFLGLNPRFELAGNGDNLWLSEDFWEDEQNIGTIFPEAASLLRSEIRRSEP